MFHLWRNSLILMLVLITLISPVGAAPRAPNTPGDLDPTFAGFGAGGITTITETNDVYGMALQPDGKIVIADFKGSNESNIVVLRYLSNGAPDTTFAGDGSATISYPGFAIHAYAVAVQSDRPRHRTDNAAEDWAESFATVVVPAFEAELRDIGEARQQAVQRFITLWAAHAFGEHQLRRR